MPAYEFVIFPASEALLASVETLAPVVAQISRVDGLHELRYAFLEEEPKTCYLVLKWESIGHHKALMAAPDYPELLEKLGKAMAAPPQIFHLEFENDAHASAGFNAPTTEIGWFKLKDGKTKADLKNIFETSFGPPTQNVPGRIPDSGAWNAPYEDASKCLVILGWESSQKHKESTSGEKFKEGHAKLLAICDIEMRHAKFTKVEKV